MPLEFNGLATGVGVGVMRPPPPGVSGPTLDVQVSATLSHDGLQDPVVLVLAHCCLHTPSIKICPLEALPGQGRALKELCVHYESTSRCCVPHIPCMQVLEGLETYIATEQFLRKLEAASAEWIDLSKTHTQEQLQQSQHLGWPHAGGLELELPQVG